MKIYEEILSALKKEYDARMTYQEIADKHDMSYSYLRALMNGQQPVSRITLETLLKMFPRAVIHLDGDNVNIADHDSVAVQNTGSGNNFFMSDQHIERIKDAVMASDIPADEKVKVYQIITENKVKQ